MAALTEPTNLGDVLKYEEDCLNYSRDLVTVVSGQNLGIGTVVSKITASGKVTILAPAAETGAQTAVGVLLQDADASGGDLADVLMLSRHGVVAAGAITWPANITAPQKAAALAQLEARGILVRESA
jgi:hypothetical protein